MEISFKPVNEKQIRQFVHWHYPPPYDIYNENPDNAPEIAAYYLEPEINAHAMTGEDGRLIGICSFGPDGRVPGGSYREDALDIGLAINPDLTGQGMGHLFIEAVLNFAWAYFKPNACRVTIAAFNHRARRVWQKAGFEMVERFGRQSDNRPFIIYVLKQPA